MSTLQPRPGSPGMDGHAASASAVAYARLAHLIETCQLPPGWHFGNEEEEAAKLGMSRTPLREALRRLEEEGLVGRVAKHRTFVTKVDPRAIQHYMTIRRGIELELVRQLIRAHKPMDMDPIEALFEEQEAAVRRGDVTTYLRADPEFHFATIAASDNRPAIAMLHTCWRHINRVRYVGMPPAEHMTSTVAEHRDLLRGLRRGDLVAIEAAIRTHTGAATERRLRGLADNYPVAFLSSGSREPVTIAV